MSLDLKVITFLVNPFPANPFLANPFPANPFPVNPAAITGSHSPFHPKCYNLAFAEGGVMCTCAYIIRPTYNGTCEGDMR